MTHYFPNATFFFISFCKYYRRKREIWRCAIISNAVRLLLLNSELDIQLHVPNIGIWGIYWYLYLMKNMLGHIMCKIQLYVPTFFYLL